MPETSIETETGTANPPKRGPGRPPSQPAAQPPTEKIEWVTREESERLETLIGKNFIRKVENPKAPAKKYYYQVISACPYLPSGTMAMKNQSLVNFNIQKFHRNKFVKKNMMVAGSQVEQDMNEAAQWVETDPKTGDSEVVDNDANFFCDSRQFEAEFKRDDV